MSSIRVALVDDDVESRAIFSQWINEAEGLCCAGEYGTAEDAILNLERQRPDVAIVDINLPGMSGIECVQRLKPLLPTVQFIILTVYSDSEHLFDALAAGAAGYLLKRTARQDLIAAVHSAHSGESPMTGSIARKVVQYFHGGSAAEDESRLTAREQLVLEYLANGYLYKEIATSLNISVFTVNAHVRHIYEKMHVRSRAQAVAKFVQRRGRIPARD
jgi:DNA-binding NarL/FixJ family response regulator